MLPDFELRRPKTVEQAVAAVADGGTPYVGGTELLAAMNIGLLAPPVLVDLKRVDGLRMLDAGDGRLRIGAATRHREVAASPLVRSEAPILAEACTALGNQRVRATGSIGGNVCFADRRSDVLTTLFALRAEVRLQSRDGRRTVPIEEFVLGELDVDRTPDELVLSLDIPLERRKQVYLRHQPTEYPTLCVAIVGEPGGAGTAVEVVVGAAVERPQRFRFASIDEIDGEHLAQQIETVEDLNGSTEYKRHLVAVFVRRAAERMRA